MIMAQPQDQNAHELIDIDIASGVPEWPRRLYLYRQTDITGVSGRGIVAHGVEFTDGTVVLRWLGPVPSTVVWPSIVSAMHVHGHGGHTVAVYLDDGPDDAADWAA